jgi:hypothetical protein
MSSNGINKTLLSENPTVSARASLLFFNFILHKSPTAESGPVDSIVTPIILETFPYKER